MKSALESSQQADSGINVLVCITAHYVEARLPFLRRVLETFTIYPYPVHVIAYTNDTTDDERTKTESMVPDGLSVEFRVGQNLLHPYDLVWSHKSVILNEFVGKAYSHFIYIEDDIVLDVTAFDYWRRWREPLKSRGLVPGFVRVEQSGEIGPWFATDQFCFTRVDWLGTVRKGRLKFTNLDSPYVASFILDQVLASEHVGSGSFSELASRKVKSNWGSRERAAMGITFDNVPRFFKSRLVVPFDAVTLQIEPYSRVIHVAGNYASDPSSDLGKKKTKDLIKIMPLGTQMIDFLQRLFRHIAKNLRH